MEEQNVEPITGQYIKQIQEEIDAQIYQNQQNQDEENQNLLVPLKSDCYQKKKKNFSQIKYYLNSKKSQIRQKINQNHDLLSIICILLIIGIILLIFAFFSLYLINILNLTSKFNKKEDFSEKYIIKSKTDKNEYKLKTLYNGLQVMIIKNTNKNFSIVALDVKAGSFQQNINGLAHLLEHILFLSNEKYPDISSLDNFLALNGGYSNAETQNENTTFYLKVNTNYLQDVLDIFSNMFISPIFDDILIRKELLAVNDEYEIDINDSGWKILNLLKLLANPQHPFSKFNIGNAEQLSQVPNLAENLQNFKEKYYTSENMKLTQKWKFILKVKTTLFSVVKLQYKVSKKAKKQ
ncbi:insulin-degrading enzyme, putative [Ichthyophthirius multifiliis]|uniref:Insulin-degrading enzyme, putative n=1 Tax=Ichthyophthirius multifiliis TaxID=5932 RepID=G0R1I8_ICHMU|nr:insulin-degrading enzyme, putative [Ichthyophthirius multifiliis]EGR28661.1 insulin-degrading enzyme, putative [Ichthyophthirius multifiliis]|eukprot:XP_004029897.1 insulin-degrading enzyme, putative [Ichthyophthirius multifiliis]